MTDIAPQPQQIALQNVTATTIRIGSIVQTINYVQRSQALSTTVNDRLPPVPQGDRMVRTPKTSQSTDHS